MAFVDNRLQKANLKPSLQVKICGITSVAQGEAIAQLGATALGYICVEKSPRYIAPQRIAPIVAAVSTLSPDTDHFGVFANAPLAKVIAVTQIAKLTVIQLHGDETPAACQLLRDALKHPKLPRVRLVKALRIRSSDDLKTALSYEPLVDALLLDAYHPDQLGGTGKTLDWPALKDFSPDCPWFLAGGLNADNVLAAIAQLSPSGIDLSSGIEKSPGDKDLIKAHRLFEQLRPYVSVNG
ncbi:MAG: phosphoribosylanthranilate isomerase [Phormidesmis sp.]